MMLRSHVQPARWCAPALGILFAAASFAACADEPDASPTGGPGGEDAGVRLDASGDAKGTADAAIACPLACFGGACPAGTCEPAVFVPHAGEDVYRIRASASRVVWSSGYGSGVVQSTPFDGGPTTKVVDTFQPSYSFDVEGETLTLDTSPSGLYQYDVTTGAPIGTRVPLPAGGLGPLGVLGGEVYFAGMTEGTYDPNGPNYKPLVSSPIAGFGATLTEHARTIDSSDLVSILPTKSGIFHAGAHGVFRVGGDLASKRIFEGRASSLTTDGTYLYWVSDGTLDGKRALMRGKLDGTGETALGPEKVLSVAAIPGRLFYAVEKARFEDRVDTDLMVLGTAP